jgi:hypothetical protein
LIRTISVILSVTALASSAIPHPRKKLSPEIETLDPQSTVKVIVQWKGQTNAANDLKVTRRGGRRLSRLNSIKAGVYTLSSKSAKDLANDPEVAHISIDHPSMQNWTTPPERLMPALHGPAALPDPTLESR